MCDGVDNSLSTGLEYDPDVDPMDVPDFFGEESTAAAPRQRTPSSGPRQPRVKDSTVRLPGGVMAAAERLAYARGDIVTSGTEGYSGDGVHATTSQHYTGTALDVRYSGNRARQVADYRRLGLVVIPEDTHLHVQAYRMTA
jgi:hypothetical protein